VKLLVFSDVHRQRTKLEGILKAHQDADMTISLGDSELKSAFLQDNEIIAIKGNYPFDAGVTYEHIVTVKGKKLLLVHGHKHKVRKGIEKMFFDAKLKGIDIALYGHTHVAKHDEVQGIHFINPGAVSKSRDGNPESYATLTFEDNGVHVTWHDAVNHEPINKTTLT